MYGRDGVAPAVGQHGTFDAGVVHLHHEGARDAGALLQPEGRLGVLVLRSNTPRQRRLATREPTGPLFFSPSYTRGTIPDVVAGVSAAIAGVVCGKAGGRLGAVATRKKHKKKKSEERN